MTLTIETPTRTESRASVENRSLTLKNMQDLLRENDALQQKVSELTKQCTKAALERKSELNLRRAALNLMQDAVEAREAEQRENAERQRIEEELRISNQRKDEFLATLAHELRNPLAPIRNGLEILRQGGEISGSAQIHSLLERQVNHLVRLVDDLMDVARITRGKIELRKEKVALQSLIENAVEISRPLIDAANHQLVVDMPAESIWLHVDPVRVSQIFANLLNNSAKYTSDDGCIWVTVKPDADTVSISVRDNGEGIAPEFLPSVFDMFTRTNSPSDAVRGGVGIGLALVRTMTELHGGSVEASSKGLGLGSEFIVRLPLDLDAISVEDSAPAEGNLNSPSELPSRILVVDDNRDAAESLGRLLKHFVPHVWTALDGENALKLIEANQPDLVLLDIGMPGMDGLEVARRVRKLAGGSAIKLVALTGWGQEKDRLLSKEAGFDHHLVKPIDLKALQKVLAGLVA